MLAVVGQKRGPNTTVHTTVQRGKKFVPAARLLICNRYEDGSASLRATASALLDSIQAVCGEGHAWYLEIPRRRTH